MQVTSEAFAESSLREAVATFHRFSKISGLTLNQGKTQVMFYLSRRG